MKPSRRARGLAAGLLVAGLVCWFFLSQKHPVPVPEAAPVLPVSPDVPPPPGPPPRPPAVLPGENILRGFADPTQPPGQDLTQLHRCLDNFLLAAKGMKDQPLSANGEIAAALRGEGRVKLAFLPASHPIFDSAGRLTDRWGTPFFFHAEQAGAFAIRSAGPDKIMWTSDDLHRLPNGAFLRDGALLAPSLK